MNIPFQDDHNFKEFTKPKVLKNNDDVESIFKEEYISVRDPKEDDSDSSSSSSQEKRESFPNESEGKLESIFNNNPFQDDNFNHSSTDKAEDYQPTKN